MEWQAIESAPTDGAWVMLYWNTMPIHLFPFVAFNVGDGYGWEGVCYRDYGEVLPTHWMPLPSPPDLDRKD